MEVFVLPSSIIADSCAPRIVRDFEEGFWKSGWVCRESWHCSDSSDNVQDAIKSPELALVAAVSTLALTRSHCFPCTSPKMLYGWTGWPVPFRLSKLYPPDTCPCIEEPLSRPRRNTTVQLQTWNGRGVPSSRLGGLPRYLQVQLINSHCRSQHRPVRYSGLVCSPPC
ncbi:hypothetical protein EV421DRAFT_1833322, partial [Armillaria borealis]